MQSIGKTCWKENSNKAVGSNPQCPLENTDVRGREGVDAVGKAIGNDACELISYKNKITWLLSYTKRLCFFPGSVEFVIIVIIIIITPGQLFKKNIACGRG